MKFFKTRAFAILAPLLYLAALAFTDDLFKDKPTEPESTPESTTFTTSPTYTEQEQEHNHTPNEKGLVIDRCLCVTTPEKDTSLVSLDSFKDIEFTSESFTTVVGQIPDQATEGFLFTAFKRANAVTFHMTDLKTGEACWIRKQTYDQIRNAYSRPEL